MHEYCPSTTTSSLRQTPSRLTGVLTVCEAGHPLAMDRKCPLCRRRRARRACPARGDAICATCCGTKRLVEISCPQDCTYLAAAHSHPPASVQRQRERDLQFLVPLLQGLTERQQHLMLLVQGFLRRGRPDEPTRADDIVEQAARALAETYETASRGIIYEHAPRAASAERLGGEIKSLIEAQRTAGMHVGDADIAQVMRRIEGGAQAAASALPGDATAYLQLLRRLLRDPAATGASSDGSETGDIVPGTPGVGSGLIVPGR